MAKAATLFERAAEIYPDDFQAKSMLANIYRSLDRPADSRAAAQASGSTGNHGCVMERAAKTTAAHQELWFW
jgi:hypothetical protein